MGQVGRGGEERAVRTRGCHQDGRPESRKREETGIEDFEGFVVFPTSWKITPQPVTAIIVSTDIELDKRVQTSDR